MLWNQRWFPIMQDIDDNGFILIVIDKEQKENTPVLDIFWEDFDGEPFIIYPSLTKMIQAEAEIYEAGYYLANKSREINYEAAKYIRQQYKEIPMKIWRGED